MKLKRVELSGLFYIFIFNAEKMQHLKIIRAKQKFADELKRSALNYCLVNPTAFFSDMSAFLQMAQKGKVCLFGNGNCKMSPVDGTDLADICVNAVAGMEREINAGGPEVLTHKQIAETAFKVLNRPVKIRYIPIWAKNPILFLLRTFTSVRMYGPIEFLMTVLTMDMVVLQSGSRKLEKYFTELYWQ
ncbi:hypothetical protein [Agriterribacter humi]|jgi:hypothetical protein|uniref:hypothetical protein n=1 Tax=Agriterribacter humi TaxID=1104781 RepID=UPI001D0159D3|nr:hypothetical protein [Agriterribacter humi]